MAEVIRKNLIDSCGPSLFFLHFFFHFLILVCSQQTVAGQQLLTIAAVGSFTVPESRKQFLVVVSLESGRIKVYLLLMVLWYVLSRIYLNIHVYLGPKWWISGISI